MKKPTNEADPGGPDRSYGAAVGGPDGAEARARDVTGRRRAPG
jgi:hypothetical protein